MKNVVIVGAGQLGSRHLQALAAVDIPMQIYVIDPSEDSLSVAVERFNAVNTKRQSSLTTYSTYESLPEHLDLAIISTSANVRLHVIQTLIEKCTITNWVLEKVLFQNLNEYKIADNLFNSTSSARVWVNCSQRLWPFFIELKTRFQGDPDLEIQITGTNWGLGCNAVHNTDIADFIWGDRLEYFSKIDKEILDSKRKGFKEFTGLLETYSASGGKVRQLSYARGNAPYVMSVFHPEATLIWNVSAGKLIECSETTSWSWIDREMVAPFQSQLTTQIVNAILTGKDCGLPSFKTASVTHIDTLKALLDAAKESGSDFGIICPVT